MDLHGNNDINNGNFANTEESHGEPTLASAEWPKPEEAVLKYALFVRLEAKPGKQDDVARFLQSGLDLAMQEADTPVWLALKIGPTTFAVLMRLPMKRPARPI
jgi:hypothetical protein